MRRFLLITGAVLSLSFSLLSQSRVPGDHTRVPPARVPSVYLSAAEVEAGLDKIDPKLIASPTGGAVNVGQGLHCVVRRRVSGPQYAITHTRDVEYLVIIKGSATLVTGGQLTPPTIDSDIYPNANPNATIRSATGITGGSARKIGVGDVIISPPGTPHWFSQIDGAIEYVEIRIPNVDPAPGIERAESAPTR
jgi:hypothetical protein